MKFLHELDDAEELFRVVADEKNIDPYLAEKDYWIMHGLWGLQQQSFDFELKGGTSLSKGFKIIDRFSEDIDIKIKPNNDETLLVGKNHDKPAHIAKRESYFENLAKRITIPGMQATRDTEYDDSKFRNAGIRLTYESLFEEIDGIKEGILLEVGFDTTTPNEPIDIDSWGYNKAVGVVEDLINNVAKSVKCYQPEYTFIEKLQTITRKVRQQRETSEFGTNFLRHFYDIHQLFQHERVRDFIGSQAYTAHKNDRFRGADNQELKANLAFNLNEDQVLFEKYKEQFHSIRNLFISDFPTFDEIYVSIMKIKDIG